MSVTITEDALKAALIERVAAIHVTITDISASPRIVANVPPGGCGQSFTALIVSPNFTGLNSLKRHRLVNSALKAEIASIHAWTAKCQTPEEYERDTGISLQAGPASEDQPLAVAT
ncbi:BolA domain-containing protein [Ceratocystis lukuohia]|uniref:BolA domain-containing protein n=1 Tax=Ceratocystis lukuohia TaxID=2019550 RepID=A0ABR4MRF8_9PEZI